MRRLRGEPGRGSARGASGCNSGDSWERRGESPRQERSLGESPNPGIYFRLLQIYDSNLPLVARTAGGDPRAAISALREEVRKMDQDLPVFNVKTLAEHMGLSLFAERVAAVMMGSF